VLQAARALLRGDAAPAPAPAAAQPLPPGARLAARHVPALLCFDEMQTTDPFNVAALKALTEAALGDGGVLLTTSNRAPEGLSRHGLHEDLFTHFVETLKGGCDVLELSAGKDYRRVAAADGANAPTGGVGGGAGYFHPLGPESDAALAEAWAAVPPSGGTPVPEHVPVLFGRRLKVARRRGGAAWFEFAELCASPLGPADFSALAGAVHTLFLANVPRLSASTRDQARRFITLVDELYNHRARLVCSAAAPPDDALSAWPATTRGMRTMSTGVRVRSSRGSGMLWRSA
jgi:predicted ATPase